MSFRLLLHYYVFHRPRNPVFANIYLANRISDHHGIFTQFFKDPAVIFSSHTMLINVSIKDFTPIHLVTFSI